MEALRTESMNIINFILLALLIIDLVFAQHEFGITFADVSPTTLATPVSSWSPSCACYLISYCRSLHNSGTGFDPRIVSKFVCYPGYQYCCPSPIVKKTPEICGNRTGITPRENSLPGQATFGEYPWMGAILNTDNTYMGGSVLISKRVALTAAHKIQDQKNLKIRFGVLDSQKVDISIKEYLIQTIIMHPNFDPTGLKNDLAILALKDQVKLSPAIGLACLPEKQNLVVDPWTLCSICGWGKDTFTEGSYQTVLKTVQVPIIDKNSCERQLQSTRLGRNFILDENNFICAGGFSDQDACTGDGGSPLVCELADGQWTVVGLVSWGIDCGTPGIPGVYVNLAQFLPWIQQQIKNVS